MFRTEESKAEVRGSILSRIQNNLVERGECKLFRYDPTVRDSQYVRCMRKRIHIAAYLRIVWIGQNKDCTSGTSFEHTCNDVKAVTSSQERFVCIRPQHVRLHCEPPASEDTSSLSAKRRSRNRSHLVSEVLDRNTRKNTAFNLDQSYGNSLLMHSRYRKTNIAKVLAPPRVVLGVKDAVQAKKLCREMRARFSDLEDTSPSELLAAFPPVLDNVLVFTEDQIKQMEQCLSGEGIHIPQDAGPPLSLVDTRMDMVRTGKIEPLQGPYPADEGVSSVQSLEENPSKAKSDRAKHIVRFPLGGKQVVEEIYEQSKQQRSKPPRYGQKQVMFSL